MKRGDRLLDQPPKGITVVEALGAKAVTGLCYPYAGLVDSAFVVSRNRRGLQLTAHRLYPGPGRVSDCNSAGCFAVKFMREATEITAFNDDDLLNGWGELARNAQGLIQLDAHDYVGRMLDTAAKTAHNPFVGASAAGELRRLAATHSFDPMLAEIVQKIPR
jgi:hypothetical protein